MIFQQISKTFHHVFYLWKDSVVLLSLSWSELAYRKNGTQDSERSQDPEIYEDPGPFEEQGHYEEPGLYKEPGFYEDPGHYEDSKFIYWLGKTQELIN